MPEPCDTIVLNFQTAALHFAFVSYWAHQNNGKKTNWQNVTNTSAIKLVSDIIITLKSNSSLSFIVLEVTNKVQHIYFYIF